MSCSTGKLDASTTLRQFSSSLRPLRRKSKGKGTDRLYQNTPDPENLPRSNVHAFILGVCVLVFCCLVSWGAYQPVIKQKLSGYFPAPACNSSTAPAQAKAARSDEGFYHQLFCPIMDLPALQGILVPIE